MRAGGGWGRRCGSDPEDEREGRTAGQQVLDHSVVFREFQQRQRRVFKPQLPVPGARVP